MADEMTYEKWLELYRAGTRIKWFDKYLKAWKPGVIQNFNQVVGFEPVLQFRLDCDPPESVRQLAFCNRHLMTHEIRLSEGEFNPGCQYGSN